MVLNRWFVLRATRSDRLRCWRSYREARALPVEPERSGSDAAREIERCTLTSNLEFWRAQDRRCFGGNRWFRRVRSAAAAGYAAADVDPAVLAPLLADPDEPFRRPGVAVLKDSPSSTVIEFDLPVAGVPRRVIYKRFAVTRWTDPWASLFRRPPALRSYVLGHGLRLRGLPTPRPLAVWHRRRLGLACEGYLLTEKVPDARELPDHVAALGRLAPAERRAALDDLIRQAGRLLAVLHDRRLSHRDLKGPNLLVNAVPCTVASRGAAEGRARRFHFFASTDLVHRSRRRASAIGAVAGAAGAEPGPPLRQLRRPRHADANRPAALPAGLPGLGLRGWSDWKAWWAAAARAFRAKVRRNRRNRRPLG